MKTPSPAQLHTPRTVAKQFEMLSDLQSGYRYVVTADFARELERENTALRSALEKAYNALSEAAQDYNSPNFTDRHNTGPRINAALEQARQALAQSGERGE